MTERPGQAMVRIKYVVLIEMNEMDRSVNSIALQAPTSLEEAKTRWQSAVSIIDNMGYYI